VEFGAAGFAAPAHLRGRIVALYLFAFVGLAPIGSLLSGWLVEAGGTALAFSITGVTGLLAIGLASAWRPPHTTAVGSDASLTPLL
jgi:hypothetical protein